MSNIRKSKISLIIVKIALMVTLIILVSNAVYTISKYGFFSYIFQYQAPDIKKGEFPLRVEIERGGERIVIEDTLIIKYDGIVIDTGSGIHRKWASSYVSGNDKIILYEDRSVEIIASFNPKAGAYLMGDTIISHEGELPLYIKNRGLPQRYPISEEYLLEQYGIKIIDYELPEPIKQDLK